jgi:hypothetical protein
VQDALTRIDRAVLEAEARALPAFETYLETAR